MGDFNTCLLKNDVRSKKLKSVVDSCNLHILPSNPTHFFPNSAPSLLDLKIVSSPEYIYKHGQYTADAFSYHDLLFLSYKLRSPKVKSRVLLLRNFARMDVDRLKNDAASINWSLIDETTDVDEQVRLLNAFIMQLYDKHAPLRPIKLKYLPAPWLTKEIKDLMTRRNLAKAKFKKDPCNINREKYRILRNRCNTMCRDAQRRHIHKTIEESDPYRVWKFLKSLGIGKKRNDSLPPDLNFEMLNQYFSSSSSYVNSCKSRTLNHLHSLPTPDFPEFVLCQVADCDVRKNITAVTSNAIGNDNVSRNMILPLLDLLTPIITKIFNNSINTGTFPTLWKDAQIIPLPKKSNPKSFCDYRPISILPFLSKILERLVQQQLNLFLNQNNLLNTFQSGFRPGHSTVTALVKITDDIRAGMENRQVTILTLLDFSNAFNTVDIDILLAVLRSINVSPAATDWFRSYLFGRRQCIRIEDTYSSWCSLDAGIPQGGVLSPLLFSIFIRSITSGITSLYHLYADDLQIYSQTSINNLPSAVLSTNRDLAIISEFCTSYGIKVNPSKTQVIVIGSNKLLQKITWHTLPFVCFENSAIPYSKVVKNLGVLIDSTMSWAPQIEQISKKMFAACGSLKRLRNFLPISTKIALAHSILLPILDYADICYTDITMEQLNKLERLQNLSIRFIFGLRKYDHVSQFRKQLKWLPIHLRRNVHLLSLLFCVLFDPKSPRYLKEQFHYRYEFHDRSLRSVYSLALNTPYSVTSFYNKSFTSQATRLWNSLPLNIQQAQSLQTFKKQLKEYYLNFPS
ncbi:unnamed protein product [Parnassius mnemosyne]|uniref:Reverse transcriptase domain-containing protein n=1 Tax=Parnassius mnemosyne TaxID=213953 RepID=A0AAV1LHI7_9NEOP